MVNRVRFSGTDDNSRARAQTGADQMMMQRTRGEQRRDGDAGRADVAITQQQNFKTLVDCMFSAFVDTGNGVVHGLAPRKGGRYSPGTYAIAVEVLDGPRLRLAQQGGVEKQLPAMCGGFLQHVTLASGRTPE